MAIVRATPLPPSPAIPFFHSIKCVYVRRLVLKHHSRHHGPRQVNLTVETQNFKKRLIAYQQSSFQRFDYKNVSVYNVAADKQYTATIAVKQATVSHQTQLL